jgi:tRNA modification GTPase
MAAMSIRNTIYALSSGRPPAAIGVIRISGPRAGDALKALTGKLPEPRVAAFVRVRGANNEIIDEALALWFPGPHSETGEDVAELQLHGGRAVIAAAFSALARIDGLRPAEAGEFTRRAFENGKLDLTAVEGLADLVMAETEAQRRQAYRQLKGLLGDRAEAWRQKLIQALALVEARIDFSDEADVPEDLVSPALAVVRELVSDIEAVLADSGRGERLRDGLVVAIAGPPNAGKSTLLNRIARREAAIVSPYAGTTRDVIEVHLDLDGLPVTLVDTAGIRKTTNPVEREGVRRAQARAADADLVLWLTDAGEWLKRSGQRPKAIKLAKAQTVWRVLNKIDLLNQKVRKTDRKIQSIAKAESGRQSKKSMVTKGLTARNERSADLEFRISASSGAGLPALVDALRAEAERFLAGAESALITRERHREALKATLAALRRALSDKVAKREDLLAEELRTAAQALGRLTGRVDVEDVLDVIFRDFCIGK